MWWRSYIVKIVMPTKETQILQKQPDLTQQNTVLCFDVNSDLVGFALTEGGLTMAEWVSAKEGGWKE